MNSKKSLIFVLILLFILYLLGYRIFIYNQNQKIQNIEICKVVYTYKPEDICKYDFKKYLSDKYGERILSKVDNLDIISKFNEEKMECLNEVINPQKNHIIEKDKEDFGFILDQGIKECEYKFKRKSY